MTDVARLVDDLRTLNINPASYPKAYQTLQATKVQLLRLSSMPPSPTKDPRELGFISEG